MGPLLTSVAGIALDDAIGSRTSVHVGCFMHDYETMMTRDPDLPAPYKVTGTSKSILANRVSWFYDLSGPSVVIDTACSSSLSALHTACHGLHGDDADTVSKSQSYNPTYILNRSRRL